MDKTKKRPRIIEIDFARGVFILFMIVDHLFFDLNDITINFFKADIRLYEISNFATNYWNWPLRIGFRFFVLAMFFLISGISTTFSKNNLKRGLIIFLVGEAVSLLFYLGGLIFKMENCYVFFGAITCFGVSILIYTLLRFLFKKFFPDHINDFKWIALSLGVVIVAIGVMFGCWDILNNGAPHLREPLSWNNFIYVIIGKFQDAEAVDWLPLFPYMGFLFIGSFIGETLYADKKSYFKQLPSKPKDSDPTINKVAYYGLVFPYKGIKNTISFTGRKSLYFYLFHQVVLILVLGIVLLSMGYQLQL